MANKSADGQKEEPTAYRIVVENDEQGGLAMAVESIIFFGIFLFRKALIVEDSPIATIDPALEQNVVNAAVIDSKVHILDNMTANTKEKENYVTNEPFIAQN